MSPSAAGVHQLWHRDTDARWNVVVKNTFVDIACEAKPILTHVWSAPGKLVTTGCLSSQVTPEACEHANPQDSQTDTCFSGVSAVASSHAGELQFTETHSPRTEVVAQIESRLEAENGVVAKDEAVEPKVLSRTAKRNQRTRMKASNVKKAESAESVPADSSVSTPKIGGPSGPNPKGTEAKAQKRIEVKEQSSPADVSLKGKEVKASRQMPGADVKAQSSPAEAWRGPNPTAVERVKLKAQFMEIFQEEYKLGKELRKANSSKHMTSEELAKFSCNSSRPLVSVHGDIFDVSRNLREYGPGGIRSFEAGSDITWAVISGSHTEDNCNCFYDVFKAADEHALTSRCMSLCSTIAAFQRDYGRPVGRLSIYNEEKRLPPAPRPPMEDVCPVQ